MPQGGIQIEQPPLGPRNPQRNTLLWKNLVILIKHIFVDTLMQSVFFCDYLIWYKIDDSSDSSSVGRKKEKSKAILL